MKNYFNAPPVTASAVLGIALLLASPAALAQTTVAGVTSGALSVNETGSAGYTIPITVPPGIAGIQPSLALVYKSHGGNGTAGVGWSLSAASSIHRCSQTLAQDGAIHGVDFSAEDRFCLDGQRLVAVSGAYGADGTEYRTEIDGFARIISHGVAGSGPERFTVESKSGQTLDYGNTTDSRLGVPGASEIRLWSLNRVTDSLGNAMTYHYIEDPADKSYRLDKVAYAYDAAVTTAKSEVRLVYEARPDTRTSYLAGAELAMTRRLTNIETWTDTDAGLALVKDYRLAYEVSPATSRSRITSITECDASNNCLAPVQPGWETWTEGFAPASVGACQYCVDWGWSNNNTYPRMLADVNGDGLPDIVGFADGGTYVSLSTGTGFTPAALWIAQFGHAHPAGGWLSNSVHPRMLVDVNGDGLADIVGFADGGAYVSLSTGTSFTPPALWVAQFGHAYPAGGWSDNSIHPRTLADVNGDGLADIVGFADGGTYVSLSTGNGFTSATLWVAQFGHAHTAGGWLSNSVHPRMLVDVNGDGLADIVGFADGGTYVSLSTGTGFTPHTLWVAQFGHAHPAGGWSNNSVHPRTLADVNGDGLPDIVGFADGGTYVSLSTGTGFTPTALWVAQFGHAHPAGGWSNNNVHPRMLADVNGDGLADIVGFADGGAYVSLSTGTSFTPPTLWHTDFGYSDGWTSDDIQPRMVDDINGNGLPDILGFKSNGTYGLYLALANGPLPDLLTSVTDSLGRVSTIDYTPLTDDTVYTKDADAVFPVVDIQAPLYVVKSVSSDDGLGGQAVTSYSYAGAKVHVQGRGFRGFRQMTATDEQTGIVTTTDYHQVFPYTAQVTQSVKTLADGTTIKTIDNTWNQLSLNSGDTVYPYVASSVSEDYEINDGLGSSPVVSRTATAIFDTYGNPTSLTTTTTGAGESFTETTVNTYDNDTTNWFLGLLRRAEVTRSRGAP